MTITLLSALCYPLVNLNFPFIRSSNCSSHFMKFLPGYIPLPISSLLSLTFHSWLLTLFMVPISNCSPLTDCILHRSLNTLWQKKKKKKKLQNCTQNLAYYTFIVLNFCCGSRYCSEVFLCSFPLTFYPGP